MYCKHHKCQMWPLPSHATLPCRIHRLQNGVEALMAPAWQASPRAHQTQPLTYSMQLHPATDTDAGSIAAADGTGSFTGAPVQRIVPSVEAAHSSCQACCPSNEASSGRHSSLNQLPDAKDGAPCGQTDRSERQMDQPERQMGPPEGQMDQLKLQPRSSSGLSDRQHGITSLSKTSALSKHSRKRLSNQQQHSAFRGVDATDHCSGYGSAGLATQSDRLSDGSMTARLNGQSPFGSMQQTGYGQADYPMPPLKVCPPGFWHHATHAVVYLQHLFQAMLCLCICRCMQCINSCASLEYLLVHAR